jgi:hypothetical protein
MPLGPPIHDYTVTYVSFSLKNGSLEGKDYLYSVKTVLLPLCCCWTSRLFTSYICVNHFHYYQFFMAFLVS